MADVYISLLCWLERVPFQECDRRPERRLVPWVCAMSKVLWIKDRDDDGASEFT